MQNRRDDRSGKRRRSAKHWSAPRLRSVGPAGRTRGGSGEANGDSDALFYDLS